MADLGLQTYRFSISWPRVLPDGPGRVNQAGVASTAVSSTGSSSAASSRARRCIHWDLPQALEDAGGWPDRDTAERFADYAQLMARELGDRVRTWITFNEPWCSPSSVTPQGARARLRDWPTALAVSHHLLLAHGLALQTAAAGERRHRDQPVARVSRRRPPTRTRPARRRDHNRWFLDPVLRGDYPADLLEDFERRSGRDAIRGRPRRDRQPLDLIGVNYYFPLVRARGRAATEPLWRRSFIEARRRSPTWAGRSSRTGSPTCSCDSARLRTAADLHHRERRAYDDPCIGAVDDPAASTTSTSTSSAVAGAIDAGVDIRGYFHWSLMDNFEWWLGYDKRFGLVHVDFDTLERTPSDSASWYRDVIARTRDARRPD